ncbi:MAG: type IX secretion system outer membrane channel protein PorV [Candidatus Onthomorpha sp.]|nr:type IX secretion system outer membrane channel protein PorV [Bacteroidales bacterium]MDD7589827.1 type IX secretion system outer membrane channel protein PorV [Bacteroidales bacterium]MDY4932409.1 type IX secretion system outer membrane channel protein PorV [Candidatus Onthomorpha sp.]MDY5825463.1 type IX secretion system outer membrane channel protein PorV [Candidatus Onthomorpha sp.]MDY5920793.1 type IX secretion system outer membrane channel protein PorV [Candidatus Onthomorpha sp.]
MKKALFLLLLSSVSMLGFAQLNNPNANVDWLSGKVENGNRIISTGVPLLLIAPDSRAGAMGDVGAASKPDANSIHWNAAKLSFTEKKAGLSFSYTPWLRQIVSDIKLMYLSGYYKIDDRSTVGGSLTYFSLGSIDFFSEEGISTGTYKPNEFAFDLAYSMKLSNNLSLSLTGRYIRSDLTQGQNVGTTQTHAANAAAADLGLYYQNKLNIDLPSEYAFGLQISNLGTKISYSDNMESSFLPANLRLGGRYTMDFDQFNNLSLMVDLNKLLVPTPPVYNEDGSIYAGMDPNVGILQGAIQSFYDAPNGLKEEMQEISLSVGAEYWYNKVLAVRAGYFYEAKNKGARQYLTVGAGLRYNVMGLDISYLISTSALSNNPLKNTLRIALTFDL